MNQSDSIIIIMIIIWTNLNESERKRKQWAMSTYLSKMKSVSSLISIFSTFIYDNDNENND